MTEQEKGPHPSNNLKEILGFDPESGERTEEVLQPIRDPNLRIPEEVQKEFVAWKELLDRPKMIPDPVKHLLVINPERLFSIEYYEYEDIEVFTRSYHSWQHDCNGGVLFVLTSRATINPLEVSLGVESQSETESSSLNIHNENFRVGAHKDGLLVFAEYVRDSFGLGPVKFCDLFINGRGDNRIKLYSPDHLPYDEFNIYKSEFYDGDGLLKAGGQVVDKGDNSVKINQNGTGYVLEIRSEQDQRFKLMLPSHVNPSKVITSLFDPVTISDPVNAPAELDDSWRFANLMEVVGVKWERL